MWYSISFKVKWVQQGEYNENKNWRGNILTNYDFDFRVIDHWQCSILWPLTKLFFKYLGLQFWPSSSFINFLICWVRSFLFLTSVRRIGWSSVSNVTHKTSLSWARSLFEKLLDKLLGSGCKIIHFPMSKHSNSSLEVLWIIFRLLINRCLSGVFRNLQEQDSKYLAFPHYKREFHWWVKSLSNPKESFLNSQPTTWQTDEKSKEKLCPITISIVVSLQLWIVSWDRGVEGRFSVETTIEFSRYQVVGRPAEDCEIYRELPLRRGYTLLLVFGIWITNW